MKVISDDYSRVSWRRWIAWITRCGDLDLIASRHTGYQKDQCDHDGD